MLIQYKSLTLEFDPSNLITTIKFGTHQTINLSIKQSIGGLVSLIFFLYLVINQSISLSMVSTLVKLGGWALTLTVSIYLGYQILIQPSKRKQASNQTINQSYYVLPSIGKTAIGFTIDPEELQRINKTIKPSDNQSVNPNDYKPQSNAQSATQSTKRDEEFKESVVNYEPNPLKSDSFSTPNQSNKQPTTVPTRQPPSIPTTKPAVPSAEQSASHWKRFYQLHDELLHTEQTYVDSLRACQTVYQLPIKQSINQKSLKLTTNDYDTIFSNIDAISQFHTMFLAEMQRINQTIKQSNNPTNSVSPPLSPPAKQSINQSINIGQLFVKYSDFLKMYTIYIGNYSNCLSLINQLTSNSQSFKQLLVKQKSSSSNQAGLDLMSYLIQPIQRIPRYEMLLTGLLQSAEQAIKQSTNQSINQLDPTLVCCLQAALSKVHAIAVLVNERKREIENASFILEIQNRIKNRPVNQSISQTNNSLLQPHRKLIRVDDVNLLKRDKKRSLINLSNNASNNQQVSKTSPLVCLLFNDLLVLVKQESYEFKRELSIDQAISLDINVADPSICWLVVDQSNKKDKVELQFAGRTCRDSWVCSMHELMRKK